METGTTLYYIPSTADGTAAILARSRAQAVGGGGPQAAKGRTSDNLGTKYPKISEALWTGVQKALSGVASPADALKDAQTQPPQRRATGN